MRYTKKTIDKYTAYMHSLIEYYSNMPREQFLALCKVCISDGNDKIGRVLNVSLPAIIACHNCKSCDGCDGCANYCYDIKDCYRHGYKDSDCFHARAVNYVFATKYRAEFFKAINNAMDRRTKDFYFRYQVAGDILDYDYFCQMVDSAIRHPHFIVWTYTKCYGYVNRYIRENGALPDNFKVMFSKWDGMPLQNPYGLPIFACKLAAGNKDTTESEFSKMYKCAGNCDVCKAARRGCIAGEDTYADEH